ncbi:uncharacterized protein LOC114540877 [Dendronephthya gigantea]|uniref:uncharacterized protein LOC114540877 n=1 Tax=Dendronephthya gigantea TaxID=151771 RepID=UPI00106BCF84|nr:uncharacterized protein LOC114540877 [Dendronephthya gigantea]
MRLRESSFLNLLKNLRLDQPLFRTTRDYAALNMNYVMKIQDLHFLNRCKKTKIIPNFISNKINLSSNLLKNKTVARHTNNLTFSILNDTIRKHHKELKFIRNEIAQKKTEMTELLSEDRRKIDHHLTECLEKLKKNKKFKLIHDESPPRVTILTSTTLLPDGTADLLDLGPQFVPSMKTINKRTELDVNVQLAKLAYRLRWKEIHSKQSVNDNQQHTQEPTQSAPYQTIEPTIEQCPFDKFCTAPETKFQHLESSLQHLKHEVKKVISKHKSRPIPSNLTRHQRKTLVDLTTLKKARKVRISVSDKGGEFVVMDSNLDNTLMKKHLENQSLYKPCNDLTKKAEEEINEVWEYVARSNFVNERSITRLKTTHSVCPVIYLLTKTHKFHNNEPSSNPDNIKRPIISGCAGPADKISWLIQVICNPLLQFVKAHLRSTEHLLNKLRNLKSGELKNKILFSLDVVSLYPSVNNDAAIDTLRLYLEKEKKNIQLYQFSISDIILLTKAIFEKNCFSWKRSFYQQRRGLNRKSSNLFRSSYFHLLRYIDDCITPADNPNEAVKIQNQLNGQDPSIQFEIELPGEDGFLPFLNTKKIKVNTSGTIETGWHTKSANKGLMLNAKSHHPEHIKRAAIGNTIKTYTSICSNDTLLQEAERKFERRARRNGYDSKYVNKVKATKSKKRASKTEAPSTFTIPFISSQFTNDIRRAVQRTDLNVRIVERSQSSLKNLLAESRPYDNTCTNPSKCSVCSRSLLPIRCSQKDVVYQINCDLCGATYVGETSRPLAVRFQEHYRSAANPTAKSYKNMAFAKHYSELHRGQKPKLSIKILKKTKGSVERKITEALFIQKLKPDLNGKYEQLNIIDFVV